MVNLTLKRNRISLAVGFIVAAAFASAAPAWAQSTSTAPAPAATSSSTSQNSSSMPAVQPNTQTGISSSGASGSSTSDSSVSSTLPDSSGASATGASASSFTKAAVNANDRSLIRQLAQDNMAELELAKIAQSKSTSEPVKNFAQKMIDDHTQVANQLQQLAEAKSVMLPQSLDAKNKAEEKKLNKLSGESFDRQYLARAGTSAHQKAHSLLQKIGRSAKDDDLKQLATTLSPEIDQHLQLAKEARAANVTSSGSSGATNSNGESSSVNGESSSVNTPAVSSPASSPSDSSTPYRSSGSSAGSSSPTAGGATSSN